jgi:hypothetical protein
MKITLLFCFMLTALYAGAQEKKLPVDLEGHVVYTNVIMASDTNTAKAKIYAAAKLWMANSFKDLRKPIEIDDAANGRLTGKGGNNFMVDGAQVTVYYSVEILVKKGKLKYKFYNIYFPASDVKLSEMNRDRGTSPDFSQEIITINKSFADTINSLAAEINKVVSNEF